MELTRDSVEYGGGGTAPEPQAAEPETPEMSEMPVAEPQGDAR
jgi:hypothetical protein